MTVYCILDHYIGIVPGTVSDYASVSWERGIAICRNKSVACGSCEFRQWQAAMEKDGYRLGRASGVAFERIG